MFWVVRRLDGPLAVRAQQAGKPPTMAVLGTTTPSACYQWVPAFVQRLRELGWIEGCTIAIESRWAEDRNERVAELLRLLAACNFHCEILRQRTLCGRSEWRLYAYG